MDNAYVTGIIGASVISYILFGIFLTIDLSYSDKYQIKKKYVFYLLIWLIPIIGMAFVYQKINGSKTKLGQSE